MLGVLGHDPQRAPLPVAADCDRRMWALQRFRFAPRLGEREVPALNRQAVFAEQLHDDLHAFLELVEALLQRGQADAQGVGLVLVPAGPDRRSGGRR